MTGRVGISPTNPFSSRGCRSINDLSCFTVTQFTSTRQVEGPVVATVIDS